MGIPTTGTGKYEVRSQVIKDNKLYYAVESYEEETDAKGQFDREEISGGKVVSAIVVAPNGQLTSSKGCPVKREDVEKSGGLTKRKWFWPVVITIVAAAGIGATIYFVRRRKAQA
jgi:hypothetical protein